MADSAVETAAASPPARGGTETVLLAEDEKELRALIRLVPERAGDTALEAADGEEGWARCRGTAGPSTCSSAA